MHSSHVQTFSEISRRTEMNVTLTEHQLYILRQAIASRIVEVSNNLAKRAREERHFVSGDQVALRDDLQELLDIHKELSA